MAGFWPAFLFCGDLSDMPASNLALLPLCHLGDMQGPSPEGSDGLAAITVAEGLSHAGFAGVAVTSRSQRQRPAQPQEADLDNVRVLQYENDERNRCQQNDTQPGLHDAARVRLRSGGLYKPIAGSAGGGTVAVPEARRKSGKTCP